MIAITALRNSIVYKFITVNLFALALFAVFSYKGWVQSVFWNDTTHITAAIGALFVIGLVVSFLKALGLNRTDWVLDAPNWESALGLGKTTYNSLVLRNVANLAVVSRLAVTMLLLGIAGTVVGLMIALGAVDPAAAKDASLIGPMAATLLHGVSIKLSTTLVGIVSNIWTTANYHVLSSESQRVMARICEAKGL